MKTTKVSWYSIAIVAVAIAGTVVLLNMIHEKTPVVVPQAPASATPTSQLTGTNPTATPTVSASGTVNLPIPFTPQAPTGDWDQLHEEACEEATSIMANAYLTGDRDIAMPPAQVEAQISELTTWEDQHFGYHLDTTAAETAQMITGFYGLNATVVENYTLQDIEADINAHEVVIIPVDGQEIGNPFYTQPGPIYHMLVIRGYTPTELISNDPGTKRGQNYPYTFATLYAAGADWNHTTNTINSNQHEMIVVSK